MAADLAVALLTGSPEAYGYDTVTDGLDRSCSLERWYRGNALSQKSSNSLHKYEVAIMQVAWLDALDQERAGAVQRDQRAAAGRGAMRLKIREVGEVGFAELN